MASTTTLCQVPLEPCITSEVCQSWVGTTTTTSVSSSASRVSTPTAGWILTLYDKTCKNSSTGFSSGMSCSAGTFTSPTSFYDP
ncbi:hypothetical protein BGW36DRAFT_432932 [Talaromyces proteolyticus]|uniref:Uncharacterized protein n=1 Tax=Talaromyces proteolyticus TaxID=1131652 RepID=A0AAD4PUC2_9EURO|nr:uncharacterized protein BGW36DRAFT_432932 [Talaromyces proteolyticus]KAH8689967.1 hypothetical protein BGW36DRAFT_432932 [Talaromyces proteolyticus]